MQNIIPPSSPFFSRKGKGLTTSAFFSRKAALLLAAATLSTGLVTELSAQGSSSDLVRRELARRKGLLRQADEAFHLGRSAFAKKDYEESVKQYQVALNLLPPGPSFEDRRVSYKAHLGDASVALAQQYRRVGRYGEARNLLDTVVSADPANFGAKKQLEYLDDPIRTNPALTYEHTQDVDKVRRFLYKGEGFFNLAKYDEAEAEFYKVLQIDKYNSAARRWLERVAQAKHEYYDSAYDHTRAELLAEVTKAWGMAIPQERAINIPLVTTQQQDTGIRYLQNKLNNIIIDRVDFDNVSLDEALDFLRLRAREKDTEPSEENRGINFVVRRPTVKNTLDTAPASGGDAFGNSSLDNAPAEPPVDIANQRIDQLKLRNVPLGTVLQYICDKMGLRYKLDEHSVILLPRNSLGAEDFYTRTFTVPPNFIATLAENTDGTTSSATASPFDPTPDSGLAGDTIRPRPKAKELLESNGVSFNAQGTFANYIAATNTLVVRNSLSNLDLIEQIIQSIVGKGPRQVRISTKFIEVSQENTDELGFDWAITPVALGSEVSLGGGSTGSGSARTHSDLGNPAILDPTVSPLRGIVTSGNRSGDYAVAGNSIDSLINNPNRSSQTNSVAPGILSLTGIFNDGSVQMIMRGLAQKKGTDVMTAPSILARSGEKATIEVVREFIYPTEYEPPQLPSSVGTTQAGGDATEGAAIFPVTPATPTAFETRNTGVVLEIEPTIADNNYTIDLRLVPEMVEFEGFINYGSPIQSPATDALGNPVQITITENRIEQPVFAKRSVNTALTIYDGYTIAIGGLMREDVQNVEDKVPILGDLPLVGRLFQTKSENHIKSNLIIFVTAEIIDAAGARINNQSGAGNLGADTVPGLGALPGTDGNDLLPKQ